MRSTIARGYQLQRKMLSTDSKVLLVGACGMLGQELALLLSNLGCQLTLAGNNEGTLSLGTESKDVQFLDITSEQSCAECIDRIQPDIVVNCAAYTNVDQAQDDAFNALLVNASGVKNLAVSIKKSCPSSLLAHFSTDYVYGGTERPEDGFSEEDAVLPCGIYGLSKLLGDDLLQSVLPDSHLILRTSWLHGTKGNNFLETIFKLSHTRDELRVVDDQYGSPTYAPWLASVLIELLQKGSSGVFNASSQGVISWYDFAVEIVKQGGGRATILPQTTAELGRPAPRPSYSVLSKKKLSSTLSTSIPDWKAGVSSHLSALAEKEEL